MKWKRVALVFLVLVALAARLMLLRYRRIQDLPTDGK